MFFKKAGHFTLDDNSSSGFKARELKTVYIDVNCQYVKLSLQKSYPNEKNIFNQAAIVSLKCMGQPLGTYENYAMNGQEGTLATQVIHDEPFKGDGNTIVPRNLKLKNLQHNVLDPHILERIEELEAMKREALGVEDFDQCKQLKQVIDKLKIIGNQVVNMEREKDLAISNEDYDIAKQLKFQIEKIKEAAY